MRNSLLKKFRADLVSLRLFDQVDNTELYRFDQKVLNVQSDQAKTAGMIVQDRQEKTFRKIIIISKDKRQTVQSCRRFSTIKSIDLKFKQLSKLQDEDETIKRCRSLTQRILILKREKLEDAIRKFQCEESKKINCLFQKQKRAIKLKYSLKRNKLKASYEKEIIKFVNSFQELDKLKSLYEVIFEDLNERKSNINDQYELSLLKLNKTKEKIIKQWKRNSIQEITKKINKIS